MPTIKILHLSDLQFGRSNRFVSKKRYSDNANYKTFAESIVSDVLKNWENAPDIIIVTGDIAESASKAEYEIAVKFFTLMLKEFKNIGKLPQLYIVPGNHDVNFGETEASEDINESESSFQFKFSNYNDFLKSLFKSDKFKSTHKHPYFVEKTCGGQLLLLGLNSAISVTHKERRGFVSLEQIRAAIEEAEQLNPGNAVRMAIVHHNFTRNSDNDDENLRDADDIQNFLINGKFRLLLHGHRHLAGAELRRNLVNGKQIFILATGSAGLDSKRLPDVPNQFQLITIELDSTVKISVQRRIFSAQTVGHQGRGGWVPDISEEESGAFHFFIYDEDIRNVVESIQQGMKCTISSKTPTIHFSKGFESHRLYSTLLDVAQDRLWIFGRKNRKLFDKDHWAGLKKVLEKRQKGFDFRVLFISPNAPKNILYQAQNVDIDFKDQLELSMKSASNFLKGIDIDFNEICKCYCWERTTPMIIVDNAVLFTRTERDNIGRIKPLTDAPFDVVSSNSTIGKDLVCQFNETWKNAKQ